MRIFDKNSKINFVDDNNVFVGYDNYQYCCEDHGWFISSIEPNEERDMWFIEQGREYSKQQIERLNTVFAKYSFDKEYYKQIDCQHYDVTSLAVFKIVGPGADFYLGLYNCHNGYYGHGFEVKHDGQIVLEGTL